MTVAEYLRRINPVYKNNQGRREARQGHQSFKQGRSAMRRERRAYHEAGHAVAIYRLGVEVKFATILPDHDCGGYVAHGDLFCDRARGSDRANLERAIQICLAGPLAEARFYPRYHRPRRSHDYDCAFALARYLTGWGAREFIRYQERQTRALLDRYWGDVERVARALLEHDQLSVNQVRDIIELPRRLKREDREDKQRWIQAMAVDPF